MKNSHLVQTFFIIAVAIMIFAIWNSALYQSFDSLHVRKSTPAASATSSKDKTNSQPSGQPPESQRIIEKLSAELAELRSKYQAQVDNVQIENPNTKQESELFYSNPEITKLRKFVFNSMQERMSNEYSLVFCDNENGRGFGSYTNTAIMGFQYALLTGRQFYMNTSTFVYGKWSDFFIDTMQKVFIHPDGTKVRRSVLIENNSEDGNVTVEFFNLATSFRQGEESSVILEETNAQRIRSVGVRHQLGDNWDRVYWDMNEFQKAHIGDVPTIMARRPMIQALWEPRPELREEITRVCNILNNSFIGVHIRRGDKFILESLEIPIERYAEKVGVILSKNASVKIQNVVVMTDDQSVYPNFKASVEKTYGTLKVHNMDEILSRSDSLTSKGWHQTNLNGVNRSTTYPHARDFIIGLSVMTKAEYVVCTFSSNICRLIQTLREQPLETVYSLDGYWFIAF